MADLKPEAERLRIGIVAGWRPVQDAIAWADRIIAESTEPPAQVLEIALAASRTRHEVGTLLRAVPGAADPVAVMRACLADLRRWIGDNPERGETAARYLFAIAGSEELPVEAFGSQPYGLDDSFALARQGTYGTVEEAHQALVEWLERHSREDEA